MITVWVLQFGFHLALGEIRNVWLNNSLNSHNFRNSSWLRIFDCCLRSRENYLFLILMEIFCIHERPPCTHKFFQFGLLWHSFRDWFQGFYMGSYCEDHVKLIIIVLGSVSLAWQLWCVHRFWELVVQTQSMSKILQMESYWWFMLQWIGEEIITNSDICLCKNHKFWNRLSYILVRITKFFLWVINTIVPRHLDNRTTHLESPVLIKR